MIKVHHGIGVFDAEAGIFSKRRMIVNIKAMLIDRSH